MANTDRARVRRLVSIMRDLIAREATDADDARELAHTVGYYLQSSAPWKNRTTFGNPKSLPNTEYGIKRKRAEKNALSSALSRARSVGQLATLTQAEWEETLSYFEHRCAYCKGIYEVIEHFIPLPHGGTTANNCVPSCQSCNCKKSSKLPADLCTCFPAKVIESISAYLALR